MCLYPLLGVLQLFVTLAAFQRPTTISLIAAAVWRPATFCHALLATHFVVLQSAIPLHSSHHMIGLPSGPSAKLIDAIKVWIGDVIQFCSVLKLCLKALIMCDDSRGVCHELGNYKKKRDDVASDWPSCKERCSFWRDANKISKGATFSFYLKAGRDIVRNTTFLRLCVFLFPLFALKLYAVSVSERTFVCARCLLACPQA